MGEIVFVGLGLNDEEGISLRGLEEAKTAEKVFIELYTSLLPDLSLKHLETLCGKQLHVLPRKELEERNGETILKVAEKGKTVLLVPGDPLIATTHVALRMEAEKRKIQTRIIHGASVVSAIMGLSGLHNYKFGKTVTIPFPDETPSDTPCQVISQNQSLGLHTLCLLDIRTEEKRYLNIRDALDSLLHAEAKKGKRTISQRTLAVGVARAGSNRPIVKAGFVKELQGYDFGNPPYSLVFPGKLHFMEAEALICFAEAPEEIREDVE